MRIGNGNGMREVLVKNKKKRETARVRTPGPLTKKCKVVTSVPLKQTARERNQEPLKDLLKGGVFRRSGRKSSGRKGRGQRRRSKKRSTEGLDGKHAKKESQASLR